MSKENNWMSSELSIWDINLIIIHQKKYQIFVKLDFNILAKRLVVIIVKMKKTIFWKIVH